MMKRCGLNFPVSFGTSLLVIIVMWVFFTWNRSDGGEPEACCLQPKQADTIDVETDEFGFAKNMYHVERGLIQARQTLSHILAGFGLDDALTHSISQRMHDVFNPRRIRQGNRYHGYFPDDDPETLSVFVYEISDLDFLVVDLRDSVCIYRDSKQVELRDMAIGGMINSSLWDAITGNGGHPLLVPELSRILAWSVDFYRIMQGDHFRVLYTGRFVGDRQAGISHVDAVYFVHQGREVEGYRFEADTIKGYFDPEGNNLRKAFLRAPLETARITSRYSLSRLHPIHGDRRPHLGTDYAAPHGTPIIAVGDGVVTRAGYTSGNGNYVRIRHNSVYETQYLHMSRFASGIRPGTRVTQGEVIGYVGSTGLATGPHVCFRFWKNGRQVDHLRLEFPSGDPVPEEYMDQYLGRVQQLKDKLHAIPVRGRAPV